MPESRAPETSEGRPFRVRPAVAGAITAVVTAASVVVTQKVTGSTFSQISPIWALIVGFVAPVYGISTIGKNRSRVSNPRAATAALSTLIVGIVVITSLLGSQESDYKVQMIVQFVVLAACCIVLVPAALDD